MYVTFFNHCCISSAAAQKQSIYKISVHGLPSCATIDDSHKAKNVHQHTGIIYFTESAHTHTPYILQKAHAHHIFYRRGDTAQNVPMRTYTPQSSIANTTCKVRAPHLLQSLLRSSAAAQKQSTCKCQGMVSLLAQRSMSRAK
jgi:hypothetical protein